MKVLFVSKPKSRYQGGGVITSRNFSINEFVFDQVINYTIERPKNRWIEFCQNFRGLMGGLSELHIKSIIEFLENNNDVGSVFIDNSLFGVLAPRLRKSFPKIFIICFFHNIEQKYFRDLRLSSGKIWHYLSENVARYNEKLACKFSNCIITLNNRDSAELYKYYGREASFYLPSSLSDIYIKEDFVLDCSRELSLLFVGSAFFANVNGIDWFVKNVYTKLSNCKLKIVGSGFDAYRKKYTDIAGIEVEGAVESLSEFYLHADIVVSPIFEGSGMKTKIAEALMFGKTILATPEAAEGYDFSDDRLGKICHDANDFLSYIKNYRLNNSAFNETARALYNERYNTDVIKESYRDQIIKYNIIDGESFC